MSYIPPAYDGSVDIDIWKARVKREAKIAKARESSLMRLKDGDGNPLYQLTESGNHRRVRPLTDARRREVISRDGYRCVWCGSGGPFEVDHIIRYADRGSNEAENLQTLCEPCHRSKGGR